MTFTPEHDKVEQLRAANPVAGNLAFLLLDSEHWTLTNRVGPRDIDIPVQTVVADLLGINFEAYQEERREELGLSRADASIAATIRSWAEQTPEPLVTAGPAEPELAIVKGGPVLFAVETRPEADLLPASFTAALDTPDEATEDAIIDALAADDADSSVFPAAADELPALELPQFGATTAVPNED